jgi:hypothetical protein
MSHDIVKAMVGLREARQKYAEAAMDYPKADPFDHGIQVGNYRGLGVAIEFLDALIRDAQEEEARQ